MHIPLGWDALGVGLQPPGGNPEAPHPGYPGYNYRQVPQGVHEALKRQGSKGGHDPQSGCRTAGGCGCIFVLLTALGVLLWAVTHGPLAH